jgi:hypothetical protein
MNDLKTWMVSRVKHPFSEHGSSARTMNSIYATIRCKTYLIVDDFVFIAMGTCSLGPRGGILENNERKTPPYGAVLSYFSKMYDTCDLKKIVCAFRAF